MSKYLRYGIYDFIIILLNFYLKKNIITINTFFESLSLIH